MSDIIVPSSWKNYLLELQKSFPTAVIGGGCLRDLWFDKPVKDIDIFICNTTNERQLDYIEGKILVKQTYNYGNLSNIEVTRVVDEGTRIDGIPVELIFINNPDVMGRFDFSICQIMYDGDLVEYTSEFLQSTITNNIKLLRCDNKKQFDRSMKRFDRLKEKYPEFIIDLNGFEHYSEEV